MTLTRSASPRPSLCILRWEWNLWLYAVMNNPDLVSGLLKFYFDFSMLTVHVPSEEVSISSSVQQQSWWELLLQTPFYETGSDSVTHHDSANSVRILFQRAPRGSHPFSYVTFTHRGCVYCNLIRFCSLEMIYFMIYSIFLNCCCYISISYNPLDIPQ